MNNGPTPPEGKPAHGELDYRWHLAKSDVEVSTTELEFALMRTFAADGNRNAWRAWSMSPPRDPRMRCCTSSG